MTISLTKNMVEKQLPNKKQGFRLVRRSDFDFGSPPFASVHPRSPPFAPVRRTSKRKKKPGANGMTRYQVPTEYVTVVVRSWLSR